MEHVENGYPEPGEEYLKATEFFDYDHPSVRAFADQAADGAGSDTDTAVKLFYAVRDGIRYDPYAMSGDRDSYKASGVLAAEAAFCIPKANLLIACLRAKGIVAGLGLSDVTNHLCTERLREVMGGVTLFLDHGYAVMLVDGKWLKAAPAFNIELCDKFDVKPSDFDGAGNSLLQEFNKNGEKHMEYLKDSGTWSEFPFRKIMDDFRRDYPETLFRDCDEIRAQNAAKAERRFEDERPLA